MIVTAAFLLGLAYENAHLDDGVEPGAMALVMLVVFMYFDYSMAKVLCG